MANITTLAEFITERQHEFTYATGELSQLLTSFRLAGKMVNREVNKAGLLEDILGAQGTRTSRASNNRSSTSTPTTSSSACCAARGRCAPWPARRTTTSCTSTTAASTW
jgi:hypothetical protein